MSRIEISDADAIWQKEHPDRKIYIRGFRDEEGKHRFPDGTPNEDDKTSTPAPEEGVAGTFDMPESKGEKLGN